MRLAGQLLAVSAVTLLLPWAGCQYAREIETTLRDAEEETLVSTTRLLAAALAPVAAELAPDPARWSAGRGRGMDLVAHPLARTPTLDGFVEDWGEAAALAERIGGVEFLVGRRGAFLYLFVLAPGGAAPAAVEVHGRAAVLSFPLDAPGTSVAEVRGAAADPRLRGHWQATSSGFQLEARIPAAMLAGRLGTRVIDTGGRVRTTTFDASPGWLTGPDETAQAALDAVAPAGQRSFLVDRAGFVLARHGPSRDGDADPAAGWPERLFRAMLGQRLQADPPPPTRPGQLAGRHIELAALGATESRRFAPAEGTLLAVAAPLGTTRDPAVLVVTERDSAEILALTRDATRRLLWASLLASVVAAAVLLGFAALLSYRVRRLRDAAAAAVDPRGEVAGRLPGAGAGDELGDLARDVGALLQRVRDHNLYLQALGGRLAHELRTPLAVVRSSLDNLEAEGKADGPWLARARDGVNRMAGLVNALAAARQVERAVASADHLRFDLGTQLADMVEAYRALHPQREFVLERPDGPCPFDGAPELVAQLLDKLVENAVDFAPPEAAIRITLAGNPGGWRLAVANAGSRLPPGPPLRLFDSLVSERPGGTGPHLGLGLFIVRLVAEHHGGRAMARNLPEGGVEFSVELADTVPRVRTPGA